MKNVTISRLGGFTLIELLVVVLIIGILAAVAVPQYQKAVSKSRVASLLPLMRSVQLAEHRFALANSGELTKDFSELDISLPCESYNADNSICYMGKVSISLVGDYFARGEDSRVPGVALFFFYSQKWAHLRDKRECYAAKGKDLPHQICQGLGGKLLGSAGTFYDAFEL